MNSTYHSFCVRMWLDYCDENNDLLSERLSFVTYTVKYKDYLTEKYKEKYDE